MFVRHSLLAALLLAGCGPSLSREEQAIQVAHDEARSRFHYAQDIRARPPRVGNRGDHWRVYFRGPAGAVGGNVMIDVRKSDLSVMASIADQ